MSHLHVLQRTGIIDQWSDDSIDGGDKWRDEIDKAISKADLAIFLISRNFLNSEFIMEEEVPALLKRCEEDGMIVFPIIARHCHWQTQDWLRNFNVRPKNGDPVWPEGDIDKKLTKLVGEIERAIRKPTLSSSQHLPDQKKNKKNKGHLVEYRTNMTEIMSCFFDRQNRIWAHDTSEVNIFQVNIFDPVEKILLPKLRYKNFLQSPWNESLICSDWDGALYQFNSKSFAERWVIRKPKFNDLPIHSLAVGEKNHLVVGTWNGKLLSWNEEGKLLLADCPVSLPYLPTRILSLPDGTICVVDQANFLRLFRVDGKELWTWRADRAILDIWFYQKGSNPAVFFLLLADNQIIKIRSGEKSPEAMEKVGGRVLSLSHSSQADANRWSVMALEGGVITWLSWSPFQILQNYNVEVGFEVRTIQAVYDAQRPNTFIALGLSREGELFSLVNKKVEVHSCGPADSFLLDNYGRFLVMVNKTSLTLISNPAINPSTCQVEVVDSNGSLVVGMYKELSVRLKNTGSIPICKIRARLQGDDCIQPSSIEYNHPIFPEETIGITLLAKALAAGDTLPLELHLELEDDFGQSVHAVDFRLFIQAKER